MATLEKHVEGTLKDIPTLDEKWATSLIISCGQGKLHMDAWVFYRTLHWRREFNKNQIL